MKISAFTKTLSIAAIIGATFIIFIPISFSQSGKISKLFSFDKNEENVQFKFFKEGLARIKKEYVEELDDKQLIQAALDGVLSSLDPHSSFFDEKAFKEMKIITSGEFGGLGIEVSMDKGLIRVISPYDNSPAQKSGIKAGDYIIAIEDDLVQGMKISEAVERLRGAPGTKVNITILRQSSGQTLKINVIRELISVAPIKSRLVAGDVIYIRVPSFDEKVAKNLKREVEKLINQQPDIKGMVLDFRENPGGLLEQAVAVTDLFLESGKIVTIKGKNPRDIQSYQATKGDLIKGLPLVILINSGTASAPEIVAGALQDNKRALIVGEKSFGKGSVQTIIPLSNGTAMKLTTAKYYTPSGRSIQAEGIEPDIYIEDAIVTPVDKSNILSKSELALKNHLVQEPKTGKTDNTQALTVYKQEIKAEEDFQLQRAADLIKGMSIYKQTIR